MPAAKAPLFYARRPFGYDLDLELDRGQVFELRGLVNDEKLIRLGYVEEIQDKSPRLTTCGECEQRFINAAMLTEHGSRRHKERARRLQAKPAGAHSEALVDTEGDAYEKRLEAEAPLYLDKTTASRT